MHTPLVDLDVPKGSSEPLPLEVAKNILLHLGSVSEILNFSLVSKTCKRLVFENDELWVLQLGKLGLLRSQTGPQTQTHPMAVQLNPINCFDDLVVDVERPFQQFRSIYHAIFPLFKDLIIDVNNSNFVNSKILKLYSDPESQLRLFSNLSRFLELYRDSGATSSQFQSYSVRLNAIRELFVNSVMKEIETALELKNYATCLRFIRVLNTVGNDELVLDLFVNHYIDDFAFLNTSDVIDGCFERVVVAPVAALAAVPGADSNSSASSRPVAHKTVVNFDQIASLFAQMSSILSQEFDEVSSIYQYTDGAAGTVSSTASSSINQLPIILKIIENFIQNILTKFVEDLIARAQLIDEREEGEHAGVLEPVPATLSSESVSLGAADGAAEAADAANDGEIGTEDTSEPFNEWSELARSSASPRQRETGLKQMSNAALYFQIVPYVYRKIVKMFTTIKYPAQKSVETASSGSVDYQKIATELLDFHFEQFLSEFIEKLPKQCNLLLKSVVENWKLSLQQQESSFSLQLLDLVTSDSSKNKNFLKLDIFSGFSKIFKVGNTVHVSEASNSEHTLTKNEANLKILTANLNNIKSLISLDLAISLLRSLKENTELLLNLTGRSSSRKTTARVGEYLPEPSGYTNQDLQHRVNVTCQEMFNDMLNILMDLHIKSGFDKALERLKNYRPSDLKQNGEATNTVDPIINFIELVNVGDLIQQMISVFYREELVNTKIVVQKHKTKRDFLMLNKCEKSMRKFETMLDNYVADGLNISIDVLMSEISYGIMTLLESSDFNISEADLVLRKITLGEPSKLGRKLLQILANHINLLTGTIDKSIVDVFQQEIGERFVNILVKLITKDLIISTTGAVILISDLNAYYNFFLQIKIKPVLAYFVALKSIAQLYLIETDNSRELGKLVVKIGRENGIFNQEEIYEFVTRRADWDVIKRDVDKIMYGLGLADCCIM